MNGDCWTKTSGNAPISNRPAIVEDGHSFVGGDSVGDCLPVGGDSVGDRPRVTQRAAFTLLEVVLALSLATVILGLVAMAIHVNLGVAEKSRGQVEEAQLARALLQRIADDLRNSVPFVPSATSSSDTSQSSGSSNSSDSSKSSESSDTFSTSDSTETSLSGGVYGSSQELQVETVRRPRPVRALETAAAGDNSQPARLSDLRIVTYSLGEPGTTDPTTRSGSSNTQGGLFRRELDRAEFLWATQQGRADDLNQATEVLAPEVVDVRFTYYDGTTASDEWDSTQEGKLPSAIRVAVSFRTPPGKGSTSNVSSVEELPPTVYDMLVDLPNATVTSSSTKSQGSQSSKSSGPKQVGGVKSSTSKSPQEVKSLGTTTTNIGAKP